MTEVQNEAAARAALDTVKKQLASAYPAVFAKLWTLDDTEGGIDEIDYSLLTEAFSPHIQELLQLVLDPLLQPGEDDVWVDTPEGESLMWAPYHALVLLGEFALPETIEPLLAVLDGEDEEMIEALPEVYTKMGAPAIPVLWAFARREGADIANAGYILRILGKIGAEREECTEEVTDLFLTELQRDDRDEDSLAEYINASLVSGLCDIHADAEREGAEEHPVYQAIATAFEEDIVGDHIITLEDVRIEFGLRPEWTDDERREMLEQPRMSLGCLDCGRMRYYPATVVYYDPYMGMNDEIEYAEDDPYGPLYIPDKLTCPKCGAVDRYAMSGQGAEMIQGAAMMEQLVRQGGSEPHPLIRFADFSTLSFGDHPQRAQEELEALAAEGANDPEFLYRYGAFLTFCRRFVQAEGVFLQLLDKEPEHVMALFYLARIAEDADRVDDSILMWERMYECVDASDLPRKQKREIKEMAETRLQINSGQVPKRFHGKKVKPNQPCLCGSGKKFKKCCINR